MTPLLQNRQEIFDTVTRALAKQGRRSSHGGKCKYRGPNGDKCAVGHILPDDRYDSSLEGCGVQHDNFRKHFPEWEGQFAFLASMQCAHDNCEHLNEFVEHWSYYGIAARLYRVSLQYKLDSAAVFECWPDPTNEHEKYDAEGLKDDALN